MNGINILKEELRQIYFKRAYGHYTHNRPRVDTYALLTSKDAFNSKSLEKSSGEIMQDEKFNYLDKFISNALDSEIISLHNANSNEINLYYDSKANLNKSDLSYSPLSDRPVVKITN